MRKDVHPSVKNDPFISKLDVYLGIFTLIVCLMMAYVAYILFSDGQVLLAIAFGIASVLSLISGIAEIITGLVARGIIGYSPD